MRYLSQAIEVKKKRKKPTHQKPRTTATTTNPKQTKPTSISVLFNSVQYHILKVRIWARQNVSHDVKRSMKPQCQKRTSDLHSIYKLNVRKSSNSSCVVWDYHQCDVHKNKPQRSGLSSCMVPEPQHNLSSELL